MPLPGSASGAGVCAMAAYDQGAMDRLLRIDGEEEFAVYLASVGLCPGPDARPRPGG